jgi:hypothetical protein
MKISATSRCTSNASARAGPSRVRADAGVAGRQRASVARPTLSTFARLITSIAAMTFS